MRSCIVALCVCCATTFLFAQTAPEGTWKGAIRIAGTELQIIVNFAGKDRDLSATIDIPQQMAKGLPLTNVLWQDPGVHFELQAGPGVAVFDGVRAADSIGGKFGQAGMSGTFYLLPDTHKVAVAPPEEKPPYTVEEVTFSNAGVALSGTLTIPATPGPHPAVVMITGSGPQNRDEEIFGFKPFRIIADFLTRRGVAVLRYDDRGIGASTGKFAEATTQDFAGDAAAAFVFLRKRNGIRPDRIGLCGHSEGAIAATMIASGSKDVGFVILLAGPAVTGDRLIMSQIETLSRAGGATDEQIREALSQQSAVVKAARTGQGWEEVRSALREQMKKSMAQMPEAQRTAITDSMINSRVDLQLRSARTPWFKFFVDYDPAPALAKISCPVLALFGELDMQVPVALNREPMQHAFQAGNNEDVTINVIPGANHLFQQAVTGLPSEYMGLKKEFAPNVLELLSDWILHRVTP
jgi:pimeloyl-ACP methyl ester carboxylesterase